MTVPRNEPHVTGYAEATEEATLPLDGGTIYVRRDGARDNPALVLIHGSGSSSRTWDPMIRLLTASHHVIRVDLLGHGRSDKPTDGDYEIPSQARRVAAALDCLGVEHVIAVGHSSGGSAATALTEQRPDLVTALALINTGPRMQARISTPEAAIELVQWAHLTDEQLRQLASTGFSRPGYQPSQQLLDDVRCMTYHTFTVTMHASRAYIQRQPLPDRLVPLGKPLLVIYGEDDRRWRSPYAADYLAVPGAQVQMLPGLGHSPPSGRSATDRRAPPSLHHASRHTERLKRHSRAEVALTSVPTEGAPNTLVGTALASEIARVRVLRDLIAGGIVRGQPVATVAILAG